MRNAEFGMRNVGAGVLTRTTSHCNSAFRTTHSAFGRLCMQEHHIGVTRTARYYTLGEISRGAGEVWFVCHGYGQLAARFLEKFRALDDGRRYLVAPEGLSRFYLSESPAERRVGASWMTREDRLTEIEDYLQYLDAVYADIFGWLDRTRVTVHALGFSQGASTVSRWAAMGKARV